MLSALAQNCEQILLYLSGPSEVSGECGSKSLLFMMKVMV